MRVLVSQSGAYYYPDLVVICGERRFDERFKDTLTNPTLIIEILSPSTELKDRASKFANYWRIESLSDYILVSQDRPNVEHFTKRTDQEWIYKISNRLDESVKLPSIGCSLLLSDIYENVDFLEEAEDAGV